MSVSKGCLSIFLGLIAFTGFIVLAPAACSMLGLGALISFSTKNQQAAGPTRSDRAEATPLPAPVWVTLARPERIQVPEGEIILPAGTKWRLIRGNATGRVINYQDRPVQIPTE